MSMYNLPEHSDNYFMTGSLWNYYRDEVNNTANKNDAAGNWIDYKKTITSKSFEYKTKVIGSTSAANSRLKAEVVVPLKYLSNVWRSLDLHLINFEIELDLTWSRKSILSEISGTPEASANPDAVLPTDRVPETLTIGATFIMLNSMSLYSLCL